MYSGKAPSNYPPSCNLQYSALDKKAQEYLSQCSSSNNQHRNVLQEANQPVAVNITPHGIVYRVPFNPQSQVSGMMSPPPVQSQLALPYNAFPVSNYSRLNQVQCGQSVRSHMNKAVITPSVPSGYARLENPAQQYVVLSTPPCLPSLNSVVNEPVLPTPQALMTPNHTLIQGKSQSSGSFLSLNLNSSAPIASNVLKTPNEVTNASRVFSLRHQTNSASTAPIIPRGSTASEMDGNSDNDSSENDAGSVDMAMRETKLNIAIDDDLEIVGTKEAAVLSHIRSDCPLHPYKLVEKIDAPPCSVNTNYCSKCYCYICDKLAKECKKWTDQLSPHCNANSKTGCWKARRNLKKSALINMLTGEELTPEIKAAGDYATKNLILLKEAYITYRQGTECEMHLVPCQCLCHKLKRSEAMFCAQCRAVHLLKKKFNYEPVLQVVLSILQKALTKYDGKPCSVLVIFEALISELCSHRPADFNHVTRVPANPVVSCQCRPPQILDEHFEWELVKVFTENEIDLAFQEKFLKCVNLSLQTLHLKHVFKRFLEMRHWQNILLRSVLIGQNTTGRMKGGDNLREVPLVIEMRVKKLKREKKYQAITRYLKAVKIAKASNNSVSIGSSIVYAMEFWLLESLARRGEFREACKRFISQIATVRCFEIKNLLYLFNLLTGQDPQSKPKSSDQCKLKGFNKIMLLIVYMMCKNSIPSLNLDFSYHLWLAKWLNQEKLIYDPNKAKEWTRDSAAFLTYAKSFHISKFLQLIHECNYVTPHVALLTCSSLITTFLCEKEQRLQHIPDIIDAYKNNEWALSLMFSQPKLVKTSDQLMKSWLVNYKKTTERTENHFEAVASKFDKLPPEQAADFFHQVVSNGNTSIVKSIFSYYTDKHECPDGNSARMLIMEKVIKFLESPDQENAMKKHDLMTLYANLCSHEAVGWLICAKCSVSMPDAWISVWTAMARNGMVDNLSQTFRQTLNLFCAWIKEITSLDASDMDRLLRCLNSFIANVVNTLIKQCKFDVDTVKNHLLKSSQFVVYPELWREYCKILEQVFSALDDKIRRSSGYTAHVTEKSQFLPVNQKPLQQAVKAIDDLQKRDGQVQAKFLSDKTTGASSLITNSSHVAGEKGSYCGNKILSLNKMATSASGVAASSATLCSKGEERKSTPCENCGDMNQGLQKNICMLTPAPELSQKKLKRKNIGKPASNRRKIKVTESADEDGVAVSCTETFLNDNIVTSTSNVGGNDPTMITNKKLNDVHMTSGSRDKDQKSQDRNLFRSLKDLKDVSVASDEEFHEETPPSKPRRSARKTSILQKFRNNKQDKMESSSKAESSDQDATSCSQVSSSSPETSDQKTLAENSPASLRRSTNAASGFLENRATSNLASSEKFQNFRLPIVHLSTFPAELLEKIRNHQPELNLKSLYA